MTIRELRILPPFAIARFGSLPDPVDNYSIEEDPEHPLGFRKIVPRETLVVDKTTGEIVETKIPRKIVFQEGNTIRPVAPFIEVFAVTDDDTLEPLTLELLKKHGFGLEHISWQVEVANRKVVRRTEDIRDLVHAQTPSFSDHLPQALLGRCANFLEGKRIDFGDVQFIRPTDRHPQLRLRFTPAKGLVYGTKVDPPDPLIPEERAIYDKSKGSWYKFEVPPEVSAGGEPPKSVGATVDPEERFWNETLPASLFASFPPAPPWLNNDIAISRGYLDDACDGFARITLRRDGETSLTAQCRIVSGPPMVVPDVIFIRSLADDLEQVINGPEIATDEPHDVVMARAEEIIRRAYEAVRFMNVRVMNGNVVDGRAGLDFDTMPSGVATTTERMVEPVMATELVDTLAVMTLHQQVFAALRGGAAPWFVRLLRQPEEVADFTPQGTRKMPALMCGADAGYLALTRRQIAAITRAAQAPKRREPAPCSLDSNALRPRNLTAQVNYVAAGNPSSTRPHSSIANCCPGLEVDFRAVWRRMFEGIVLREYDNLVVEIEDPKFEELRGHRLLLVDGTKMITTMTGPSPAGASQSVVQATEDNPDAVAPLEWSNALARIIHSHSGKEVKCDFSVEQAWYHQVPIKEGAPVLTHMLKLRQFFEGETAVISTDLARPGELTQGLCSPWQNDYRECSCYYWSSARPDYVNVEEGPRGLSRGDNWLQKKRNGEYVPDDYQSSELVDYDDLFREWERWLRVVVGGRAGSGDSEVGA